MSKLRLDYLLIRGHHFEVGDCYSFRGRDFSISDKVVADTYNVVEEDNKERLIKSFATRKNNGSQPVPDDFPVVVTLRNKSVDCDDSIAYEWAITNEGGDIETWKPDLEKLIEQQNEYDKAKAMSNSIAEKEQKIVDAVNSLGGKLTSRNCLFWGSENYLHITGKNSYVAVVTKSERHARSLICTTKEFNQCAKEMSLNKYGQSELDIYSIHAKQQLTKENSDYSYYEKETKMQDQFETHQDVYFSGGRPSLKYKFGCYTIEKGKCILLHDGGCSIARLDCVSSKSPEEIELEEAKNSQIDKLLSKYGDKVVEFHALNDLLNAMQNNSELAEIVLPLKEN